MPILSDYHGLMELLQRRDIPESILEQAIFKEEEREGRQSLLDTEEVDYEKIRKDFAVISSGPQKFEAFEHEQLGTQAFAVFLQAHPGFTLNLGLSWRGDQDGNGAFSFAGKLCSPGQISALAGDYYGVVGEPISQEPSDLHSDIDKLSLRTEHNSLEQRQARFMRAFNSLKDAKRGQVDKILSIMADETEAVMAAPGDAARAFAKGEWWRSFRYHCHSNYIALATDNQDHFWPDNLHAYETGHELAIAKAREAATKPNRGSEKQNLLLEAFLMECFAQHFMGDGFASGHQRVPRKELVETLQDSRYPEWMSKKLGGLLSKKMHDEDNTLGVAVGNSIGYQWVAFGDKHLIDDASQRNKEYAIAAMTAGFEDIFLSYTDQKPMHYYRYYWPTPITPVPAEKHLPLFKVDHDEVTGQAQVVKRKTTRDLEDRELFTTKWSTVGTLFRAPKASDASGAGSCATLDVAPLLASAPGAK